jgi:hypothetical protein
VLEKRAVSVRRFVLLVRGVTDADAIAFVVVLAGLAVVVVALDAACGALLAVWLLLVDDVQPAINNFFF